jgi:hypothetical protein
MKHVFLGLLGGLVVYEFVALKTQSEGDTISEIMWEATTDRPIVPFALGVVMGHLFWQHRSRAAAPLPSDPL